MKKSLKLLTSLVIFFTPKIKADPCQKLEAECHCSPYQSDYDVSTDYDFNLLTV